jgi:phosphate transport system substrate-binding protein
MKNSIGYVEYTYALKNSLSYTQLKNREGQFVQPNTSSFKASAANTKWNTDNGFNETTTNEPGKDSWPIAGITFILMHKTPAKPDNSIEVLKFFDWAFTHGDSIAVDLNYAPLPENVKRMILDSWKSQIKSPAGAPLWK